MKFYYPKFLKVGPNFVGLTIIDLILLVASLFFALVFNLTSIQCLILVFISIAFMKIISLKYPRGYFQLYHLKRSVLDWREDLIRLTQGVFI